MRLLAPLAAAVLYVILSIAACFAGLFGLVVTIITLDAAYISRIFSALDRLLAAMSSWDGKSTVSRECGLEIKAGQPCRFCSILCAILGYKIFGRWPVLEVDHCEKAAA